MDLRDKVGNCHVTYVERTRSLIFHPVSVVAISIASALLYAWWVTSRFPGGNLTHHYIYVVPIVVPFVAFILDRADRVYVTSPLAAATDALVVFISLLRMLALVPLISGHALFLGYAVLRPGSLVTRVSAALLLSETVYLKFFVWHDPVSPTIGIALATAAALFTRRIENTKQGQT
ncbi:MAG TPA: hypothetical protein VJU84_19105 [Pyrinomonadaceae bacterium]|nr:hypothetical protein [Pyrinomonadaceae bacterium]